MPHAPSEIIERWMDPNFKFFINREEDRLKFLSKDGMLKDEYLGACLDYIRWGSEATVMYELGTSGMIKFIQKWMGQNKENLIWHSKPLTENILLPYIHQESCTKDKSHKGIIKDHSGLTRCSNNSCYSLVSERGSVLSLEKILDRLNLEPRTKIEFCPSNIYVVGVPCKRVKELSENERTIYETSGSCPGHLEEGKTVHPFSGWTLAHYVQKWYEQMDDGKAPIFSK